MVRFGGGQIDAVPQIVQAAEPVNLTVGYQPQLMAWQISNLTLAERSSRLDPGGGAGGWGIRPMAMLVGTACTVGPPIPGNRTF